MNKLYVLLIAVVVPLFVSGQVGELAENFKNPPSEYSILPFWSWNGTLKPEKLKWQIDQMMDKGIDGAFLHARSGLDESETPYFSEGFWNAVDTTIRYSASKGFHAYLYDEDKWPSGSAGGRTVAANPEEFVKKFMEYSKMEVVGPQVITLNQRKKPMAIFAGKISDKGVYEFSTQQNLTDKANGSWNVPAGRWAIISFEMVKDPHQQIDYLDSAAVAKFIEITHETYFKRYGKYFGNTIPGVFFDEIYANGSSMDDNIFWTDDFNIKFRKIKGYDLTDKLPLIIFNDPANSAKTRYDYFDVVAQLYNKAWFKQYADWCEAHKIWATGHTTEKMVHYKRQSDYFTTMGQLQVPGTDNEEYRYGYPRLIDWYNTKQISSIANLYKRKRVMAETMGSGGYTIPLEEYRYGFSMLGVYGINLFIPHLFHYTVDTPESQADWPPSWFYDNPYWKYFKPLADFAKRISYLNSQGQEVCDVAILYPLTDLWEGGYPARVDDSFYKEIQQELIDNHINYNIIDPVSLARATITGNRLEAGNGKYRVLVLPEIHAIRSDVMKQVSTFVEKGGIVVALKSLPELSETGSSGDQQVASLVEDVFGIPPESVRPEEYFQWNAMKTERYTERKTPTGGSACFTRFPGQLPQIINERIKPDLEVITPNAGFLRFNHRFDGSNQIFLLMNDRNTPEKYLISLREIVTPSIWNPETGTITPVDNYRLKDHRLELSLDFKPRESYFLVLAPGKLNPSPGLITSTDLVDLKMSGGPKSLTVEGWGRSGTEHNVVLDVKGLSKEKKWKSTTNAGPISLSGDWQFQLAPKALDQVWNSTLEADTLEVPVMKFHPWEESHASCASANLDDSSWKTVKITDLYNNKQGVQRYLGGWNGWWISYYNPTRHLPPIGGGSLVFRKKITLSTVAKEAHLAITADESYRITINGQLVGSDHDWKSVENYQIEKFLKPGNNSIEVTTTNSRGLLLEGNILLENGITLDIRSDDSWLVSSTENNWQPAFQLAAPPQGTWGAIRNPLDKLEYPLAAWYRCQLPPGAVAILKPDVIGKYTLYVNGTAVPTGKAGNILDISSLLKNSSNILALCVTVKNQQSGLISPLKVICKKTTSPLDSWTGLGLKWYSGRVLYTKKMDIPASCLNPKTRLILDLGKVDYFAEIWVNGKLVTFCPWGPYQADITGFVKAGGNDLAVVVSNLLANKATWNILDDNLLNAPARWWHDGSILREKEKLESGLLGPVQVIPYNAESVEFAIDQ
jgi:hypothetical protein